MMNAVLTPISVAILMTAKKQSFFIYKLFFKKVLTFAARCGIIERGVQRAGNDSGGPNFRSDTPICNFSATSSDFPYAPGFPVKWDPEGPIGKPHIVNTSIESRGPIGPLIGFLSLSTFLASGLIQKSYIHMTYPLVTNCLCGSFCLKNRGLKCQFDFHKKICYNFKKRHMDRSGRKSKSEGLILLKKYDIIKLKTYGPTGIPTVDRI